MGDRPYIFDRSFLELYQGYPGVFGDPDGRRADLDGFVDISELRRSAFFSPSHGRVRIVVGKKGSGKTLYLKKLRSDAVRGDNDVTSESAVVVEAEQTQLLGTSHVLAVSSWYSNTLLTEIWQQAWGRSILLSLLSQFLFNDQYRDAVDPHVKASIQEDFRPLLRFLNRDERSPFTALKGLIVAAKNPDRFAAQTRFSSILDNPLWDDLESRLARVMQSLPPVFMFLDAIDEEFAHAPLYWMRCQKGLFYEVMRLLRHAQLGSKLHVVISIRELVLHSVFRSEHAPRYVGDPRIRVLEWGFEAAGAFLDNKVRALSPSHWPGGRAPSSLSDWIGFSVVTNRHGRRESVYNYLLRHTQCLPRELVIFGNLLGRELDDCERRDKAFGEPDFHYIVSVLTRLSGLVQLEIAANQVRADEIPVMAAAAFDFTDSYTSVQEYSDQRAQELIDIISPFESLRIRRSAFLELQDAGRRSLGAPDLGSVLWQCGVLGFVDDDERDTFFSLDRVGRFVIPSNAKEYVFHPSMREVAGLLPSKRPVEWRFN